MTSVASQKPGHRDRQDGEAAPDVVAPGILPQGRIDADRDGDELRDHQAHQPELDGHRHLLEQQLGHRQALPPGGAEVALEHAADTAVHLRSDAEKASILGRSAVRRGQICAPAPPGRSRPDCLIRSTARSSTSTVLPGDEVHEQKDHHADQKRGRDHQEKPSDYVCAQPSILRLTSPQADLTSGNCGVQPHSGGVAACEAERVQAGAVEREPAGARCGPAARRAAARARSRPRP